MARVKRELLVLSAVSSFIDVEVPETLVLIFNAAGISNPFPAVIRTIVFCMYNSYL